MKNITYKCLILAIGLLFYLRVNGQVVQENFAGWANVLTNPTLVTGNYKFRISGFQGNPKSFDMQYSLSDLTAGDILWSNTCSRFVVVSRTLDTLVVSDPDAGSSVLPVIGERIGFVRELNLNGYKYATTPQFGDGNGGAIIGTSSSLAACINTHYAKNMISAGEITKYTGSGSPAFTPTSNEPKLAQGLASPYPFYAYNGSAWVLVGSGGSSAVTSVNGSTGAVTVQPTLVSATNIKTINGSTLLGSGDLVVSGSTSTYDAGNGCIVTATGAGIAFTRPSAGAWTMAIPTGVRVLSFKINSTAGQFFGANVTITYDYTGNTLTNQGVTTQEPPATIMWCDASSAFIPYTSGGTATANWRSSISSVGIGDIAVLYTPPSAITSGATIIIGNF